MTYLVDHDLINGHYDHDWYDKMWCFTNIMTPLIAYCKMAHLLKTDIRASFHNVSEYQSNKQLTKKLYSRVDNIIKIFTFTVTVEQKYILQGFPF